MSVEAQQYKLVHHHFLVGKLIKRDGTELKFEYGILSNNTNRRTYAHGFIMGSNDTRIETLDNCGYAIGDVIELDGARYQVENVSTTPLNTLHYNFNAQDECELIYELTVNKAGK